MPILKNHCGQSHKTNTALVVFTSLYIIGAAVALSAPYWVSSTSMLAPLAAFAATPLGMGILAVVAIALTSLAIYAISKNNKISEVKAPKIVIDGKGVKLLVTKEVHEQMKKNNQVKDEKGKMEEGKCYIDFSLEGKNYRIIVDDIIVDDQHNVSVGNILLLNINSLKVKNDKGEYEKVDQTEVLTKLAKLGLDKGCEFNTYLGSVVVEQAASKEKAKN